MVKSYLKYCALIKERMVIMSKCERTETKTAKRTQKYAEMFETEERKRKKAIAERDIKIREEIQTTIRRLAQEGKSKLGIMNRINMQYRMEIYKPYRKYFEAWVDSALSVRARTKNKESEELER